MPFPTMLATMQSTPPAASGLLRESSRCRARSVESDPPTAALGPAEETAQSASRRPYEAPS